MSDLKYERSGHVPVIDMNKSDEELSVEFYEALTTVGFACICNSGIWELAQDYGRKTHSFFHLPLEEKKKYSKPNSYDCHYGWLANGRVQLEETAPAPDYKEVFHTNRITEGDRTLAPPIIDSEESRKLRAKFEEQASRILYLLGVAMKLKDPYQMVKAHSFTEKKNPSNQSVVWYPKVDKSLLVPGQLRCGEHSDFGSLTLLYSDAPGLQVMSRELGEYVDAGFIEGGIYVNIGDMLQMWSGDVLIATKHRVLLPEAKFLDKERVSVAFFGHADDEALLETLDGSNKYPPITARQYLRRRFSATYGTEQ